MVTIPSEPAPESGPHPHRARPIAESFGTDAARYDRTRPSYPAALIDRVVAGAPGRDVLDVGCGTGIAARQFQAAGCRVLGVEPDVRMAEFAREHGLEVEVATIEQWDSAGRRFDAVVAGQSWHWVDPVAGARAAAAVARPGGLLALLWHVFRTPEPVSAALADAYRRAVPDGPFDLAAAQRDPLETYGVMQNIAADGLAAAGGFDTPQRWRFDWDRYYTRDEWLDLFPTQGAFTRLEPAVLAEIQDGVATAIDALGGGFTLPYVTVALVATRSATV